MVAVWPFNCASQWSYSQCRGRGAVVNGAFFPVSCHAGSPGDPSDELAMDLPEAACHTWCQGTEGGDLFGNG